jgi:hypothetical protein
VSFTPLALSGNSTSTGTATPTRLQIALVATGGNSTSSGSVTITSSLLSGAFDDFAVTPWMIPDYTDPALSHVVGTVPRVGGSDPVNQWVRLSITASAPTRYPVQGPQFYNRAAYAGVTVYSDAMPAGSTQQVAYAQLERTHGNAGGANINIDRPGINLLDVVQSSYEGKCLYTPDLTAIPSGASYARTNETAACGQYCGKYVYVTPAANTYQTVQAWGTYLTARAQRQTYANLDFDAPPGVTVGTGPGQTIFTLLPRAGAYAQVTAGIPVVAEVSISIATYSSGQTGAVRLLEYDANFNQVKSTDGTYAILSAHNQWQRFRLQTTLTATTAWAVVVPVVRTTAAVNSITFHVDEHRLFSPTTVNPAAVGASPARPWQPPRQLLIQVAPTRINYCTNPSFTTNVAGLATVTPPGATAPTFTQATGTATLDGTSGLFTAGTSTLSVYTSAGSPGWQGVASTDSGQPFIAGLKPSTTYTVSAYTAVTAGAIPVTLWVYDGQSWVRGTTTPPGAPSAVPAWYRISATFTTTPDFPGAGLVRIGQTVKDMLYYYGPITPGSDPVVWQFTSVAANRGAWNPNTAYSNSTGDIVTYGGQNWSAIVPSGPRTQTLPQAFYVDRVQVENGRSPSAYFSGGLPSLDYIWEGTPNNSRSFHYRGRGANQYRLDQAIRQYLPLGAQYQLVYAPPA